MRVIKMNKDEKQHAIERLKEILSDTSTIYTLVTTVSQSGMSRSIKCLVIYKGELLDISALVAKAIEYRFDNKNGGVKIKGCGMDMGWHLVENALSYALYGETSKVKQRWI